MIVEGQKSQELIAWVKACRHFPIFERIGFHSSRAFRYRRINFLHIGEAGGRGGAKGDRPHKRRKRIQDLIRHALPLCEATAPQGRAPRGKKARPLSEAIPKAEKGTGKKERWERRRWRWQIKRAVAKTAEKDGGTSDNVSRSLQ